MTDILTLPKFHAIQQLPFTIAPASSPSVFSQVLQLRHVAYGKHDYVNEFKSRLLEPDKIDQDGHSTTLAAVEKLTGRVLGTVRLVCNMDGPCDLPEGLPYDECLAGVYAYMDRYAILASPVTLQVSAAFTKAVWLWALGRDARWLVALARAPLARRYRRQGGLTVRGSPEGIVMSSLHAEPYYLVAAKLGEALQRMRDANPTFVKDFVQMSHPDIRVFGQSTAWPLPPVVPLNPLEVSK